MEPADLHAMATSSDTVAKVFRSLGCPIAVLDSDGTIVATNERWEQEGVGIGGVGSRYLDSERQADGQDLDLVLAEGIERVLSRRADRFELEHPVEGPAGRRWHLLIATPLDDGAVVMHVDVTAHHDVREILDARAHRDPLTGLPNRLAITQRLTNAINRGRHQGSEVSVVFLDLDGFKAVNDGLGHDAGDEVLHAVGRRLERTIRSDDVLGRWGGDEFVVVVEGGGEEAVQSLAARLHAALEQPVAVSGGRLVELAVSVGAAGVGTGDTPDDVMARADLAMFESKRRGLPLVIAGAGATGAER